MRPVNGKDLFAKVEGSGAAVSRHRDVIAATRPTRASKPALLDALKAQPPQGKEAEATRTRAAAVRERCMEAVADTIVGAATVERTQRDNPVAATFCGSCCSGSPPPPMPRPARRSQPAPAAPS